MHNPLELPLALCLRRHKNPSESLADGHEQSPTRVNAPLLLHVV